MTAVSDRPQPYQYAILRVVPRVERGEAINVGVIVFSRPLEYLDVRIDLDETLLRAVWPACDAARVRAHLDAIERIAAGDEAAGPIARLTRSERFHWLVAPSSTVIQPSVSHTGLTRDPQAEIDRLHELLVVR